MKKQISYFSILALLIFLASCNPKVLSTTATEDTLSVFRAKYAYEREKFDIQKEEGVSIIVDIESDTIWLPSFNITQSINGILDYIPQKIKKPWERIRVSGFRIQIYRGRNRADAEEVRKVSFGLFPRHRPYLIHEMPTYRVQVGDFINEQECQPVYRVLRRKFPTALIVPSIVNVIVEQEND